MKRRSLISPIVNMSADQARFLGRGRMPLSIAIAMEYRGEWRFCGNRLSHGSKKRLQNAVRRDSPTSTTAAHAGGTTRKCGSQEICAYTKADHCGARPVKACTRSNAPRGSNLKERARVAILQTSEMATDRKMLGRGLTKTVAERKISANKLRRISERFIDCMIL